MKSLYTSVVTFLTAFAVPHEYGLIFVVIGLVALFYRVTGAWWNHG